MSKDTSVGTGSLWQCTVKRHHNLRNSKKAMYSKKKREFWLGSQGKSEKISLIWGPWTCFLYPLGTRTCEGEMEKPLLFSVFFVSINPFFCENFKNGCDDGHSILGDFFVFNVSFCACK
jgi:hypothetical protein